MATTTGFQQQQPFAWSAAVRSAPSQRPGTRLDHPPAPEPVIGPEEKSVSPRQKR